MNRIRLAFAGFLVGLAALWFLADSLPLDAIGQHAFRAAFTQLSGILAIGIMSFATLLSIRPRWLEPTFDGLDKMYRLHKWLGVGGSARRRRSLAASRPAMAAPAGQTPRPRRATRRRPRKPGCKFCTARRATWRSPRSSF